MCSRVYRGVHDQAPRSDQLEGGINVSVLNVGPRRTAAAAAALGALLTLVACSSEQTSDAGQDPGWTSSETIVEDVKSAGFDCSFENSEGLSQIITENPWTEEPLGGALVLCNGFQVFFVGEIDSYFDTLKADCSAVTQDELGSEALGRVVVVGSNFVISGTGEDQAYPEDYGPDAFAAAFGASERTLRSIYEEVCPSLSST